ncbi:ComEC/Rec2 family competence protein [Neomicrococcus lactis]|uniref:Competence protein ComEC n=1 Tax=Neomicrococcus lactis TaxID=732241 RepID=A0A7W8YA08_9MICC|nr:ComEC/Rec2 family competence protein [Neomicrococcus lactis]MBB5597704.1 competence protein ComEC [Neomicrococcus lactis]
MKEKLPKLELRTAWLAIGSWITALILLPSSLEVTIAVFIGGALSSALSIWVLTRGVGLVSWFAPLWSPMALAVAGATVIAGVICLHQQDARNSPLTGLIQNSTVARLEIELLDAPRATTMNTPGGRESTGLVKELSGNDSSTLSGDPHHDSSSPARAGEGAHAGEGTRAGEEARTGKAMSPGTQKKPNAWLANVRVQRFSQEGRWFSAHQSGTILLSGASIRNLDAQDLKVGDRFEVLAKLSAAEPGSRSAMWIRPQTEPEALGRNEPSSFQTWVEGIRSTFGTSSQQLPGDAPALLPGMVMGDRSGQSDELEQAMKDAGLAHLTAVSGANCSLILGFIALLLRSMSLPRWVVVLGCMLGLLAFVFIVYPEPSVVRAAVMGSIAALAVFAGRSQQALAALSVSVTVLLMIDPLYANEPAFQLSVCATAGIVIIGRPLAALMARFLPDWLAQALAVALAAQIACLPVLTLLAPQFSTWSTVANIVVSPLIPFITVLGTLALLLGALSPALPLPLIWVSGILSSIVGAIGRWFAGLPFAVLEWPEGTPGALVACTITALLAVGLWSVHRPMLRALLITGSAAVLLAALVPLSKLVPVSVGEWSIAMCDVGQGDGFVIRTGLQEGIVIDSGPDPALMDQCLKQLDITTVSVLFITHLHADHAGGISGVMHGRTVERIYYSTAEPLGLASNEKPGTTVIEQIHARSQGGIANVSWTVISPESPASTENDASLVIQFSIRGWQLLATGDIEADAVQSIIRSQPDGTLKTNILKISHHGARNGGTAILEAAHPGLALISVGADNTYGHPAPNILEKLEQLGIPAVRTDLQGLVLLTINDEQSLNYRSVPTRTRIE